MPIQANDLVVYASVDGLGGPRTEELIPSDIMYNLFDTVHGPEALAGDTEYRCFYWRNNHTTISLQEVTYVIKQQISGGYISVEIGLGASAPNGVEPSIPDESTAPPGVIFDTIDVVVPMLMPIHHQAVWVKRIVQPNAPATSRLAPTLALRGESIA